MIQRKQTLWLFIAALLNAGVFYFDLYRTHTMVNGVDAPGIPLRVSDHYPSMLVALVMTALPFITIFLFGNRKRQMRLCFASLLAIISFVSLSLGRVGRIAPVPASGMYWIGAILPAIAFIFIILAMFGIRRDQKLVKSVDRLR